MDHHNQHTHKKKQHSSIIACTCWNAQHFSAIMSTISDDQPVNGCVPWRERKEGRLRTTVGKFSKWVKTHSKIMRIWPKLYTACAILSTTAAGSVTTTRVFSPFQSRCHHHTVPRHSLFEGTGHAYFGSDSTWFGGSMRFFTNVVHENNHMHALLCYKC